MRSCPLKDNSLHAAKAVSLEDQDGSKLSQCQQLGRSQHHTHSSYLVNNMYVHHMGHSNLALQSVNTHLRQTVSGSIALGSSLV